MPTITTFSEAQREFVRQAYLGEGLGATAIVGPLNARFGTAFSLKQVQRLINDRWSKPKRAAEEKLRTLAGTTDPTLVRELVSRAMDGFAEKAVLGAQRAFALLETAEDARAGHGGRRGQVARGARARVRGARWCGRGARGGRGGWSGRGGV